MHRLHDSPAKDLFSLELSAGWTRSIQLRALGAASSCPVVVVVQPTHDQTSDYLLACVMTRPVAQSLSLGARVLAGCIPMGMEPPVGAGASVGANSHAHDRV